MIGKFNVAAALIAGAAILLTGPATVRAGDSQMLDKCIAAQADDPNQERVRSECMWKHWEKMASWGR